MSQPIIVLFMLNSFLHMYILCVHLDNDSSSSRSGGGGGGETGAEKEQNKNLGRAPTAPLMCYTLY